MKLKIGDKVIVKRMEHKPFEPGVIIKLEDRPWRTTTAGSPTQRIIHVKFESGRVSEYYANRLKQIN